MPLGSTNSNVPRPPHKLDKYRDLIKVWYLDEGRSNKQICDSLKGQPYFCDVTQKQLEARLRLWGMRKNMKKADYEKINLEQVARLARNPHSQTEVCFRDKIVSPTILKKARQRYGYQPPDLIARMTGVVSIGHEAVEISRSDLSMEPDSRAVVRCRTPIHELDTYMSNLQAFQLETLPIAQFSQDLPHILDDYLIKVHSNTLIGDSFITEAEVNILTDNCALDTTRDGFEQQLRQTQYNGGFFADSRWEHDLNVFQELHYLLAEASRGGPIDHQLIISPTDTKSILKLLQQGGETAESFGRTFLQAIIKSNDPKNLRLARLLIDLGIKLPTSKLLEAFSRADLHIDTIQFLLDLMSKVYAQHSDRRRDPEIAFLGLLGHITEGPAKHPWPIDEMAILCRNPKMIELIMNRSYELLESIIGFGVLVYNPAAEKSPLLVAIKAGNSKAFKLLLANGGRKLINSPYRLKVGDLHDSVCRDRKCPETREQRCKPFVTPLVLAAAYGSLELVIILLAEGADVNFSTPQTTTALEAAVQNGRLDTVRLLLNAGATQAGKAWSWAQNGFPAISKMLKDHMDAKGITPEEPEVIHELDDDDYDVDDDDYDADDDDYDVYDAI
ncbi:hypothetical protein Dda_5961 [Drechslerella dactyloides]|uniref:Clr5 domain-containing protein n=1 Tax=Drechslerella dactyloides TaxID=74499 RepID=A0AAD6IUU8_DREDA|nr:hypothetical protein Dda_5961 [Drechslerella dactyloides]